jgi:hypothetical protein
MEGRRVRFTLGMTALFVVLAATGCSSAAVGPDTSPDRLLLNDFAASTSRDTSTATSQPALADDYTRLVLDPRDVSARGDVYTAPEPSPGADHHSAGVLMVNRDQTRAIGVDIAVLPNSTAATAALSSTVDALKPDVSQSVTRPLPVGTDGTVTTGIADDGSKAMAVALFTEGRALARIEFDCEVGLNTDPEFVLDAAQKQDIALRVGVSR